MTVAEFREHLQNPPKWVWAYLAAAVLGVAAFLRGGTASELESRIAQLRDTERKVQRTIQGSVGLEEQIARLDGALLEARQRMVDPDNRGENLRHFFTLAQEEGVTISSVGPLPVVAGTHFRAAPFRVAVTGEYEAVLKFVRKIETGVYFFAPRDYRLQVEGMQQREARAVNFKAPVSLAMNFDFVAP